MGEKNKMPANKKQQCEHAWFSDKRKTTHIIYPDTRAHFYNDNKKKCS